MPPSMRQRAPAPPQQYAAPVSDSDDEREVDEILEDEEIEDEALPDEDLEVDAEEVEDEEDEEALPPSLQASPIPPNFREISTLASWTVSSSKPGCSIPQLRHPSTHLFWQSDGPQPHYLNIHFFKLVRIVGLRLFLDFDADESYTPTRIIFLAGSGGNDLVEWGEMKLERPKGWIWADFEGVGEADSSDESDEESDENELGLDLPMGGLTAVNEAHNGHESDFENATPVGTFPGSDALDYQNQQTSDIDEDLHDQERFTRRPQRANHAQAIFGLTPQPQRDRLAGLQLPSLSPNPLHGPTHPPPTQTTPHLPRPHPRHPLSNLTPNTSPNAPRSANGTKKPKTPVLRAHLVQIKILENHQNGKDTHLRGLQIFAKDEAMRGGTKRGRIGKGLGASLGMGGDLGMGMRSMDGRGAVGARGSGGGLGSSWDVNAIIR